MKTNTRTGSTLGLAAAVAALLLSGCGNPGTSGSDATAAPTLTQEFPSAPPATPEANPPTPAAAPSPAAEPTAAPAEILIKGFKYQDPQTVSPGASINVTNQDIEAHTITADTGDAFDVVIKPGTDTFTAPKEPGTYPYHCIFHGNMKGTLTVK